MQLKRVLDDNGSLYPLEFFDVPFIVERLFFIKDVPKGTVRGGHAHLQCVQALICISGIIKVKLDYGGTAEFKTISPGEMIIVNEMTWSEQTYLTDDAILLVLCSMEYTTHDYIRDYDTFKSML